MNLGLSVRSFVRPSVRPFVRLSRSFLGIGSLDFFEFLHVGTDLCEVVHDRVGFCQKIPIVPKKGKMGPKWAKNRVFRDFSKNLSLTFSGFALK